MGRSRGTTSRPSRWVRRQAQGSQPKGPPGEHGLFRNPSPAVQHPSSAQLVLRPRDSLLCGLSPKHLTPNSHHRVAPPPLKIASPTPLPATHLPPCLASPSPLPHTVRPRQVPVVEADVMAGPAVLPIHDAPFGRLSGAICFDLDHAHYAAQVGCRAWYSCWLAPQSAGLCLNLNPDPPPLQAARQDFGLLLQPSWPPPCALPPPPPPPAGCPAGR